MTEVNTQYDKLTRVQSNKSHDKSKYDKSQREKSQDDKRPYIYISQCDKSLSDKSQGDQRPQIDKSLMTKNHKLIKV